MDRLEHQLQQRRQQHRLRQLRPVQQRQPGRLLREDRDLLDFSANDYLGLSQHPRLREAAIKALQQWGTGSAASRLLSGTLALHRDLEEAVAAFKHKPAALVFNSGYQANVGLLSGLCDKGDIVLADRLSHASLLDGLVLSGARWHRFRHNDMGHLETLLKRHGAQWVITESVFSMDGDLAPLNDLVTLAKRHGARILVDEAHATGIFGNDGAGRVSELGLSDQVDLVMGTFSKALGSFGAYVACDAMLRDLLINLSRSFIYSTSLPPAVIAANQAALEVVHDEPQRRTRLLQLAADLRAALQQRHCEVVGESQIVPWVLGEDEAVVRVSGQLEERGLCVPAIRPPTVSPGQARLRISLSAAHSGTDLRTLLDAIDEVTHV